MNRDEAEYTLMTARDYLSAITYLILAVWSLIILGCAGTHSSPPGRLNDPNTGGIQNTLSPLTNVASSVPPEYRIGILDELEIRVRYHERLNVVEKVRPDGRMTLQDVGDIHVAGMTPSKLDSLVTKRYGEIIHAPEVTVFVRNFANLAVYALGEVDRPGIVEMKPKMTVLQVVAAAGGPIRGAKMNSVIMLRRDEMGTLEATRLDLQSAALKHAAYQDQDVQPEDIIYVPKTFIANVNDFLTQVYDGLFPPFDIYLRALREYNRVPR
jgi:protein involved in polysaccharide export with SLBB domain